MAKKVGPGRLLPINMLKPGEDEHDHIAAELLFTDNTAYEVGFG